LFLPGAPFIILGMHRKKPFHYKLPGNTVKQSISSRWIGRVALIVRQRYLKGLLIMAALGLSGCATIEENPKKNIQLGLITTPPTYYTTQKARYLGEKYKSNLDRLVERIVRNPKTTSLQFANNIASVGGIGFFTHSATSSVDERFLEIIMGVPETFDSSLDQNAKVHRVFSLYGAELLSILASDSDIYREKEVNGYGLNLSWRNLVPDAARPRISLERSTLYFPKARVRSFLQGDLSQNILLSEAVIFAVVEDGPMKLVSYRPQELKPDSRRPIQEEPLIAGRVPAKPEAQSERPVSEAPATKPIMVKEPGKSAAESLSLSNAKTVEPTAQIRWPEQPEDRDEEIPEVYSPTEVSVASSASPMELSKPKESPVNQTREGIVRKPESKDLSTKELASREQETTESKYAEPKGDLASLPVLPVLPPITTAPKVEKSSEEQLKEHASLEIKPAKTSSREEPVTRLSPVVLQGFVIQLGFSEMRDAQLWAETLERRGFAVSLTEAGNTGSVRVRIGNFTGREDAERQLQALRQDGLKGMVLNLPRAYRPQFQSTPAEAERSEKTVSAIQ
jgi:cell division protein FtsN